MIMANWASHNKNNQQNHVNLLQDYSAGLVNACSFDALARLKTFAVAMNQQFTWDEIQSS